MLFFTMTSSRINASLQAARCLDTQELHFRSLIDWRSSLNNRIEEGVKPTGAAAAVDASVCNDGEDSDTDKREDVADGEVVKLQWALVFETRSK